MKLFEQVVKEKGFAGLEIVVQGNIEFALALYQELKAKQGNLFFSPGSISKALAMTYAGARGNTAAQMAQALHFHLDQEQLHAAFARLEAKQRDIGRKGHVQLKVANALWPQQGYHFLAEFLALIQQYYGVLISAVDYSDLAMARGTINAWVEEKTERKIQELIPSGVLDSLTRLVLVNAIYFKGNWASQFDPSLTRAEPFWVAPDEQIDVPMMRNEHELWYGEGDGLQVLELPYAGNDLSMVVLLPREIGGLADLEEHLSVENLVTWAQNLRPRDIQVFLPRFEITYPFRLDEALKSMGMTDAFEMDTADFSGMDGTKLLYMKAVLHKAFVAVNEAGTEAAAATSVEISFGGLHLPPAVFRADHPFLFLIRENSTGSILFLGRVVNPV